MARKVSKWRARVRRWAVAGLIVAACAVWAVSADRLAPPPPLESEVRLSFRPCGTKGSGPCVIDGDTVAIGQRRVRLTGYDAPEMDGACEAERAKAQQAKAQLHHWLARGPFTWTGGEDPPRDRYGRELREARRGSELLADTMIGAGLAEGSGWGAKRVDWCERQTRPINSEFAH